MFAQKNIMGEVVSSLWQRSTGTTWDAWECSFTSPFENSECEGLRVTKSEIQADLMRVFKKRMNYVYN